MNDSSNGNILTVIIFILLFFLSTVAFSQSLMNSYLWLTEYDSVQTIQSRFQPPSGFHRISVLPNSYGHWLRNLPLLPKNSPVKDYQGKIKSAPDDTTIAAVINYNILGKKLEQCMDIIIRLRAEYLRSQHKTNEMAFYLPINYLLKWNDWKNGFRPIHRGIKIHLVKSHAPDSSRYSFEKFLQEIFYYSNTQTAYFNYHSVEFEDIHIGDFIVKKGNRGHAVLIVDLAIDSSGNKIALIGQGDTPARQFYLLNYKKNQPWIPLKKEASYPLLPIRKKMYWEGLRRFSVKKACF